MWRYLAQRLVFSLVTLFLVASLVFTIVRVIPGDPAEAMLGDRATQQAMNEGTIVSAGESILAGPMTAPNVMEPSVHCYRMQGAVPCSIATPLAGTTEELRISLQFDTKELPFLQVWQDMRAHRSDVVFPTFAPGDFALQA